jgi:hypothetical protein
MRFIVLFCAALSLSGCFAAKSKRVEARGSLTAAQYLIEDMGVAEKVRANLPAIAAAVEQQMVALWPDSAAEASAARAVVEKRSEPMIAELQSALTQTYSRRFSLAELQAIDIYETGPKDDAAKSAFQATPAGAKYFAQQPQIRAEMHEASVSWGKRSSVRFMEEMKAELRKRGHSI